MVGPPLPDQTTDVDSNREGVPLTVKTTTNNQRIKRQVIARQPLVPQISALNPSEQKIFSPCNVVHDHCLSLDA